MKRVLLALALAAALPAAAQSPVITVKESPRWGSFQISISPYSPNIDSEFTATPFPPYATIFGTSRPLMVQALFNKSLWVTQFGTLELGLGVGFWQVSGEGIYQAQDGTLVRGGSTNLMLIPIQAQVGSGIVSVNGAAARLAARLRHARQSLWQRMAGRPSQRGDLVV